MGSRIRMASQWEKNKGTALDGPFASDFFYSC
jgi:hypothetical protein